MLIESETGVPSAEQVLSGWPKHSQRELEVRTSYLQLTAELCHFQHTYVHMCVLSSYPLLV